METELRGTGVGWQHPKCQGQCREDAQHTGGMETRRLECELGWPCRAWWALARSTLFAVVTWQFQITFVFAVACNFHMWDRLDVWVPRRWNWVFAYLVGCCWNISLERADSWSSVGSLLLLVSLFVVSSSDSAFSHFYAFYLCLSSLYRF